MGVYIPNMEKPKSCGECRFESTQYVNNYCRRTFCNLGADYEHCPLIEIDDTVWENEKYKLIRMTNEARFNKVMAERRADEHNTERD